MLTATFQLTLGNVSTYSISSANSNLNSFAVNHIPKPPASENTSQENAAAASTDQPEEPSQTATTSDAQNTAAASSQTNDGTSNAAPEESEQPSSSDAAEDTSMNVDPPAPAPAHEAAPVSAPENGHEHVEVADQTTTPVVPDTVQQPDSANVSQPSSQSSQSSEEADVHSTESSQGSFVAPLVDIINPVLNFASEPQTQTQTNGLGQSQKDELMLMSPSGDVHMAEAEQNGLPISSTTVSSATTQVV